MNNFAFDNQKRVTNHDSFGYLLHRHKHVKASWSNDVGWTSGFSEVFFCMRVRSETVYCPPLILLRSFIRVFALSRAHTIVGWRRSFIDDPTHD